MGGKRSILCDFSFATLRGVVAWPWIEYFEVFVPSSCYSWLWPCVGLAGFANFGCRQHTVTEGSVYLSPFHLACCCALAFRMMMWFNMPRTLGWQSGNQSSRIKWLWQERVLRVLWPQASQRSSATRPRTRLCTTVASSWWPIRWSQWVRRWSQRLWPNQLARWRQKLLHNWRRWAPIRWEKSTILWWWTFACNQSVPGVPGCVPGIEHHQLVTVRWGLCLD